MIVFGLPVFLRNNYHLMVLNVAALNILVVIGLNLLMGYAARFPLAMPPSSARSLSLRDSDNDLWVPCLAHPDPGPRCDWGRCLCDGIPTLKLEGHYLVMATLGFNVIVYIIMVQWDAVTGGLPVSQGSRSPDWQCGLQYGPKDLLPLLGDFDRGAGPFFELDHLACWKGDGCAEP